MLPQNSAFYGSALQPVIGIVLDLDDRHSNERTIAGFSIAGFFTILLFSTPDDVTAGWPEEQVQVLMP